METCVICKIEYPDEILAPLIGASYLPGLICGICALELSNKALNVERYKFMGEKAEHNRQQAIQWRLMKQKI